MNYLLFKNNNWVGPFNTEEIKRMVKNGTASPDDYICLEDRISIYPIKAVPDLFVPKAATPPPIPRFTAPTEKKSLVPNLLIAIAIAVGLGLSILKGIEQASKKSNGSVNPNQIAENVTFEKEGTDVEPILKFQTKEFGTVAEMQSSVFGQVAMWKLPEYGESARLAIAKKILEFVKSNPAMETLQVRITIVGKTTYDRDKYGNRTETSSPSLELSFDANRSNLEEWRRYTNEYRFAHLSEGIKPMRALYYKMSGMEDRN